MGPARGGRPVADGQRQSLTSHLGKARLVGRRAQHDTETSPLEMMPESRSSLQIALLRGVNVGGGKKVPMAELRAIAESLGCTDVRSLLNSGNLVYRTRLKPDAAALSLHDGILDVLGVDSRVFVRTPAQMRQLLQENPMPEEALDNPSRFVVTVWSADVTPADLRCIAEAPTVRERFLVGAHAAYLWFPDGMSASTVYEKATRGLGDRITARNWNTMQKLLTMATDVASP